MSRYCFFLLATFALTAALTALPKTGLALAVPPPDDRLSERDRARLEEQAAVVTKMFVAELRKSYTDETAGELRKFIDPRYLKEHKLQEGAFPITRVRTGAIFDNRVSDDPRTLMVVTKTAEAEKEAFLFRVTIHEGQAYILPLTAPDPTTKAFKPWILRVKV